MAARDVIIPGSRSSFTDDKGLINPVWLRFLIDLYERTGGGATDKVDTTVTGVTTAQSTADGAVTDAASAQTTANTANTTANTVTTDVTTLKGAVDGTTTTLGFYGATPSAKPTITGSRAGNAALADLITKLETQGILTDSTS